MLLGRLVALHEERYGTSGTRCDGAGKIKHVVFIVQENRSFDNMFQGYPGADTVPSGKNSKGETVTLQPYPLKGYPYDIDHSAEAMFAACNGTGTLPGTKCRMDGFDKEQDTGGPANPQYVYVPHSDSKPYFDMHLQRELVRVRLLQRTHVRAGRERDERCVRDRRGRLHELHLGQECDISGDTTSGQCVCDPSSCSYGCCNGNACEPYSSQLAGMCGTGGVACVSCGYGESCSAGACTCGGTSCLGCCNGNSCIAVSSESDSECGIGGAGCAACTTGQACDTSNDATSGQCICDVSTCPGGCCDGNLCVALGSETSAECGPAGSTCTTCVTGQECNTTTGQCVCDPTSCPDGCCNGSACVPWASENNNECGTGGVGCAACAATQACDTSNDATAGQCICNATTCPQGCCDGNVCVPLGSETSAACGAAGSTCAACVTGQECNTTTGQCVCDATSCTTGCCNGNTCVPLASETNTECGPA